MVSMVVRDSFSVIFRCVKGVVKDGSRTKKRPKAATMWAISFQLFFVEDLF